MKLLVAADLHFNLPQFDWILERVEHFDVVVIAGDLLDLGGHLDLDSQITVINQYLKKLSAKTRLLVSSGNHDGDEQNEADEFVARWLQRVRAEGLVVDYQGLDLEAWRLTVFPWWDGPVTCEQMKAFLKEEADKQQGQWIWVHHAPPDQEPVSWTGKQFAGDAVLCELIAEYRPKLVFSGHIHTSPFRKDGSWYCRIGETWAFNAGFQMGAEPAHLAVDLEQMTATWGSQAGIERLDLTDAQAKPVELA